MRDHTPALRRHEAQEVSVDRITWFGRLWDRWVAGAGYRRGSRWSVHPFSSAMYGQIACWTRWGAICVGWPRLGRTWAATGTGPYLYVSPNATPWASTLLLGGRWTAAERRAAAVRRAQFGHGYDTEDYDQRRIDELAETLERLQAMARIRSIA